MELFPSSQLFSLRFSRDFFLAQFALWRFMKRIGKRLHETKRLNNKALFRTHQINFSFSKNKF